MGSKEHWEAVYGTKAQDAVSWYRAHLERSLQLIDKSCPDRASAIIDVGGGESTLVDDLLKLGYHHMTVLDISEKALDVTRQRLGPRAEKITWLAADVTKTTLPASSYDLWHDRAVFHFLTGAADRKAYVRQVASSVKLGGHVIVATFGPEGPIKCSGLEVVRYGADQLHAQFGAGFVLEQSAIEVHQTPSGTAQQFLYCLCKRS